MVERQKTESVWLKDKCQCVIKGQNARGVGPKYKQAMIIGFNEMPGVFDFDKDKSVSSVGLMDNMPLVLDLMVKMP